VIYKEGEKIKIRGGFCKGLFFNLRFIQVGRWNKPLALYFLKKEERGRKKKGLYCKPKGEHGPPKGDTLKVLFFSCAWRKKDQGLRPLLVTFQMTILCFAQEGVGLCAEGVTKGLYFFFKKNEKTTSPLLVYAF